MNRWKSSLTCSYCSKIFKDPIELPCEDFICQEHLTDRIVKKQNKIVCVNCKNCFEVKDNDFNTSHLLSKLLDEKVYLNDEEIVLKQKIENSIKVFFQIYEEFVLNKNKLDLASHEHFSEIRRQIDIQREKLKDKIDEIALEMIDQTKKFETSYMKILNEKLETSLNSIDTKTLDEQLKEMEEKFREPNLLIESIHEMQHKQEKKVSTIRSKLNEMEKMKDQLIKLNSFKKSSSFSLNSFGSLNLNEYLTDPFSSQILTGRQPFELLKLCELSSKTKWKLLYRGSQHGFSPNDFHSRCDGFNNTLTIIKAESTEFIFGGFNSECWDSSGKHKADNSAFLFSLTNRDNFPCKMKIRSSQTGYAICCWTGIGPTFGSGSDIRICEKMGNCTNLGYTYFHPQYKRGTNEAQSFLAGSYNFQLNEIEVYQKI